MPEVLEIIKRRWPEVVLVLGFQIGVFFLKALLVESLGTPQQAGHLPFQAAFFMGMGTVAFAITAYMFLFGFLATACHEGLETKEPVQLLRAGKYFFWRMVRFEILFSIFWLGLVLVLSSIIAAVVLKAESGEAVPNWVFNICMFAAMVILVKPMFLTPAVMIANDKMVLEAVRLLKEYRLTKAKDLLVLVGTSLLVMLGLSVAISFIKTGSSYYYTTMGFYAVLSSGFVLLIGLTAIRFVALTSNEQKHTQQQNVNSSVTQNSNVEKDWK